MAPHVSPPGRVFGRLTTAGLRDRIEDDEGGGRGGFQVWTEDDGQVAADWLSSFTLFDESQQRHASHQMTAFDEGARAIMNHALASVLYAAGFTVTLCPGPAALDGMPKVIVTATPHIRAWAAS